MASVDEALGQLAALSSAHLKSQWRCITASPLPRVSPNLLRLAIAWELQARAYGGISRTTRRRLDQLATANAASSSISSGTRLVREWQGTIHIVTIGENGIICWNKREWRNLYEVARAITGTHLSGPAFFGLKKRARVA